MTWHDALALAALAPETPTLHRIGTTHVVLVRQGDAVHAFDAVCPHKFSPMQDGTLEGACIVCPVHDAHFQLTDGVPREGDGWAGTLPVYEARVMDGTVQVRL